MSLEKDPSLSEWQPIATAPKNAKEITVKLKDGTVYEKAHWACDMSGEEQPPFKGWFIWSGYYYSNIPEPEFWKPCLTE